MLGFRVWGIEEKCFLPQYDFIVTQRGTTWVLEDKGQRSRASNVDKHEYVFMQSTGQYDKDDIEMFEGDLVWIWKEDNIEEIKNVSDFLMHLGEWDSICFKERDESILHHVKVIGNVYENPITI